MAPAGSDILIQLFLRDQESVPSRRLEQYALYAALPNSPEQAMEAEAILGAFHLPEFRALGDCIRKSLAFVASCFDERNNLRKMVFKEVLKEAHGDGGTQVLIGMRSPFPREAPDLQWLLINILTHGNDGVPARILSTVWGRTSR
jgi:hypothetical protein